MPSEFISGLKPGVSGHYLILLSEFPDIPNSVRDEITITRLVESN